LFVRENSYTASPLLLAKSLLRMQAARRCRFINVRSTVRLTFRPVLITMTVIKSVDINTFYYHRGTWFLSLLPCTYTDLPSTNHPLNQPKSILQLESTTPSLPVSLVYSFLLVKKMFLNRLSSPKGYFKV